MGKVNLITYLSPNVPTIADVQVIFYLHKMFPKCVAIKCFPTFSHYCQQLKEQTEQQVSTSIFHSLRYRPLIVHNLMHWSALAVIISDLSSAKLIDRIGCT